MSELTLAATIAAAAALAGLLGFFLGARRVASRVRALRGQLRAAHGGSPTARTSTAALARLPDGSGEVGQLARAINDLLAGMTSLEGEAIDQSLELEQTQRALDLAEDLAQKQRELEARLRERAVLFEVLRESTESHDLGRVLETLATRVGEALALRELAVFLRGEDGLYRAQTSFGVEDTRELMAQAVAPPRSGPWASARGVLLVPDISRAPPSVARVAGLRDDGSYAAVPIVHGGAMIGLLALTRAAEHPLTEQQARMLEAVADQAALAIHNAQLVARLESLATHDELTDLPNRRLLGRRLGRSLARAERYGSTLSVLALDLDHFKALNDRSGHAAGDAALVAVAEVLRSRLRELDTPARVGGEELVVLLPDTAHEPAREAAEDLRGAIAELTLEGGDAQPGGHLSVSIGVATYREGDDADSMLARADGALYRAKAAGRDRVESE